MSKSASATKKVALVIGIVLLFCLFVNLSFAEETASGNYEQIHWSLSDDGLLTISGTGPLPDSVQPWYGNRSEINRVVIESGITRIGSESFEFCPITDIIIPDTVTSIGNNAFYSCGQLATITLPKSVTSIENSIFTWCDSLSNISVDPQNPSFCSIDGILFSKDLKTIYVYPADKDSVYYAIPDGTETIGYGAFFRCTKLKRILVPETVNTIVDFAFAFCNSLEDVNIPSKVTAVTSCSFEETALEELEISSSVTSIDSCAFYQCSKLTKLTIPNSVTFISDNNAIPGNTLIKCNSDSYAFTWAKKYGYRIQTETGEIIEASGDYENIHWSLSAEGVLTVSGEGALPNDTQIWYGCRDKITKVIIETGITRIGNNSFQFCPITDIMIAETVTSIGGNAFYSCNQLERVFIPKSVVSIENSIFTWCGKLSEISVDPANPSFCSHDGVMFSKDMATLIAYPPAKTGTTYTIPQNVTRLGYGAFFRCNRLQQIVIPDTVTIISDFAFAFCSSLKDITVPYGVKEIASCAFEETAITEIELPNSVTSIESCAFYLCSSLNYIVIPNSVEYIDENNSIPAGTVIKCEEESYAEEWASQHGYTTESYPHTIHKIAIKLAVKPTDTSTGLTEGEYCSICGTVITEQKVIPSLSEMRVLWLPLSVETIDAEAFLGNACEAVIIPNGCTSIGERAFANCRRLLFVKLPKSIQAIATDAFEGCDNVYIFIASDEN